MSLKNVLKKRKEIIDKLKKLDFKQREFVVYKPIEI